MGSLVSVVVVNFNGRRLIGACLDSLRRQTYCQHEVIVVDNGSTDGSAEWIHANYPEVQLVALSTNRGFAGGNNAGIDVARGAFVATINNDARAEPSWIEEMVRVVHGREDVGMVAAKLLFADAPTTINSAGIAIDRAGFAWDRLGGCSDGPDETIEVFGPCAGAALYRRELLDDVGGFDEDFFMYLEDVDLAWRARLAGWRCLYAPRARVLHDHSATAVDTSPFKGYHLGRNKVWLIAKNYPAPDLWLYLPIILGYDLGTVLYSLAFRRTETPYRTRLARAAGRLAALGGLRRMLVKRASIQGRRRVPLWRVRAEMSAIASPWELQARYVHLAQRNAALLASLTKDERSISL
jgi:GT2 family glycosyltransferase